MTIRIAPVIPSAVTTARPAVSSATPAPAQPKPVDYGAVQALEGVALLEGLGKLAATGHVQRSYEGASEELYTRVADLDGDDRVLDLYTGQMSAPVTTTKDAWAQRLSVEHTWPRSEGAKGIAEADLHHLQVADKEANGARSSLPFGEVQTVKWTSRGDADGRSVQGTSATGELVFEPADAVKGDIARGLFYFATRYPEQRDARGFNVALPDLLRWHEEDPVTADERARNDAVQAYQGNRNAYVDNPEFVDRVGQAGFLGR
ncbi:MAG: endonuclease [Thermoleophilia bacterium]|nr:endonuclease [Thermoleophilia bacterium]